MQATHRYSLLRAALVQSHVQFRGDSMALTFQLRLCIRRSAERLFVGVARETKRSNIRYSLHSLDRCPWRLYSLYFYYYEISLLVFVLQ